MPDWLIERGIGETRCVRVRGGEILEARIMIDGLVPAGTVLEARAVEVGIPAIAEAQGQHYLLPAGAQDITKGAATRIEVTREKIPGHEPWKRPLARVTDQVQGAPPSPAGEQLPFPSPVDRLEEVGWSDLLEEARSGIVRFAGGELRISPTPAMTVIDVDGRLPPFDLAIAAARVIGATIVRHGVGGSIGIDFPTVAGKGQRQAIGEAVDAVLPKPFERTAVNGFGFLQIVRRRSHASLFELACDRPSFEARAFLRRLCREQPGAKRLIGHPRVVAAMEARPEWLEALARQIGGAVSLQADPSLPMSESYAEAG